MDWIESSYFFPEIKLSVQASNLIAQYEQRRIIGLKGPQLKLLKLLDVGCYAERVFPDYKLTANDYQAAAQDLIVLQAWLAYLPAVMRDIHVTRFLNEMCFTNKLNVIKQLSGSGLQIDRLPPEFIVFLERRARSNDYLDLAAYLSNLLK